MGSMHKNPKATLSVRNPCFNPGLPPRQHGEVHHLSSKPTAHNRDPSIEDIKPSSWTCRHVETLHSQKVLRRELHNLNPLDPPAFQPRSDTYRCLLQSCIAHKSLEDGKQDIPSVAGPKRQSDSSGK